MYIYIYMYAHVRAGLKANSATVHAGITQHFASLHQLLHKREDKMQVCLLYIHHVRCHIPSVWHDAGVPIILQDSCIPMPQDNIHIPRCRFSYHIPRCRFSYHMKRCSYFCDTYFSCAHPYYHQKYKREDMMWVCGGRFCTGAR